MRIFGTEVIFTYKATFHTEHNHNVRIWINEAPKSQCLVSSCSRSHYRPLFFAEFVSGIIYPDILELYVRLQIKDENSLFHQDIRSVNIESETFSQR